jgi:hypothetical protein
MLQGELAAVFVDYFLELGSVVEIERCCMKVNF